MHSPIPRPPDPGEYLITWITPPDRGGGRVEVPLNPPGLDFFTLKTIAGLGVADREIQSSPSPDGGITIDGIRYTERQIVIPLRVRDRSDTMAFKARWRFIGQAFAKTARYGPGTIRLDYPDGTSRQIDAVYQSGWGNDPNDGAWIEDTCSVSFLAPDPFWRDTRPTVLERMTEAGVDYLDPYPNIGSGKVLGDTTLTNPGQVDVWPSWVITGPMTSLTATNNTRNQSFTLTYPLGAGETITMSSRPIQVRGPAGQNLVNALNLPTGKPWRLDADYESAVTFTAAGSGPGTSVVLSFTPGYELA